MGVRGDGRGNGDPHSILGDRRVTHLSDPDANIGLWFGHGDDDYHAGAGLAWDAFILFDPDATFATLADHLETMGTRSSLTAPARATRSPEVADSLMR